MFGLAGVPCVSRGWRQKPGLESHIRELGLYPEHNGVIEVFYGLSVVCSRDSLASSTSRSPQPLDSSLRSGGPGSLH